MKFNNETHCQGCRNSFESYDMTKEEGYTFAGKNYCSDSCQQESEVAAMEQSNYEYECGIGSHWEGF